MYPTNSNSALESLAAFAIVAAASVLTTISIGCYTGWVRRKAEKEIELSRQPVPTGSM